MRQQLVELEQIRQEKKEDKKRLNEVKERLDAEFLKVKKKREQGRKKAAIEVQEIEERQARIQKERIVMQPVMYAQYAKIEKFRDDI